MIGNGSIKIKLDISMIPAAEGITGSDGFIWDLCSTAMLNDLQMLLPHTRHIHLHDNFGTRTMTCDHDYGQRIAFGAADIHLPLGWGKIPVVKVLQQLREWDGIINLEIELRFHEHYRESLSMVRRHLGDVH